MAYHPPARRDKLLKALPIFEQGLSLYRVQHWGDAAARFREFLEHCPGDVVAGLYIDRCSYYTEAPPGADWDGVWTLTQK